MRMRLASFVLPRDCCRLEERRGFRAVTDQHQTTVMAAKEPTSQGLPAGQLPLNPAP